MDYEMQRTMNASKRSMKTAYVLKGSEAADGSVAVLEVTTHHFPNSKAYASSVNRTRTRNDGMFTVSTYDLFEPKPVPSQKVRTARYSAKQMQEVHADFVAHAEHELLELLQWASEKEAS